MRFMVRRILCLYDAQPLKLVRLRVRVLDAPFHCVHYCDMHARFACRAPTP